MNRETITFLITMIIILFTYFTYQIFLILMSKEEAFLSIIVMLLILILGKLYQSEEKK